MTPDALASLTVDGGRASCMESLSPSSLSMSLEWPSWAAIPVIGDPVHVAGWVPGATESARALFGGHVTDVAVEGGVVSLLAVDPSRRLDGAVIGGAPWPMETWSARVARVLDEACATLPAQDAQWIRNRLGDVFSPVFLRSAVVPWRDVDARPALELLDDLVAPLGYAWCHVPHRGGKWPWMPLPPDPQDWRPGLHAVTVLGAQQARAATVSIDDDLIEGDPGPRLYQNLGVACGSVTVSGPWVDAGGRPVDGGQDQPTVWQATASIEDQDRRRYGASSRSIDTGLAAMVGSAAPTWMAGRWLARTGHPTWGLDGVLIPIDGEALTDPDRRDRLVTIWERLFADGPSGTPGAIVTVRGVTGSTSVDGHDASLWVLEGVRVEWIETGWDVMLTALTDPAVYRGAATHPPIDPRNAVSLADPLRPSIPSGGTLLTPMLHAGGVQGAAGGWWRVVAPDHGLSGPVVANLGGTTLVPTPPLPAGEVALVVQHLDAADATAAAHWLELVAQVHDSMTWAEIPAGMTWAEIPAGMTWRDAADAAAWIGG